MRQLLLLAATLTLLLHTDAVAFYRGSTITRNAKSLVLGPSIVARMEHLRGGATLVADEDVEEGEEEVTKSSLASSTKAKIASKKKSSAKKAVNKQLGKTTANALKPTSKKAKFRLPYLVRTLFNPVALLTMTKAYWASLFNLNYLQEEPSQELRSALETKAKKATGGGSKGKRKMRRGQAKTLSDLPQLNT